MASVQHNGRTTPHGTDGSADGGTGAAPGAAARRDLAVRAAVAQGLISEAEPVVALLDVAGIRASAAALRTAFDEVTAPGTAVLHAFAVKAAPLVAVVRLLGEQGIGAEVASPGELALARAAGVRPEHTVLDSPAKTTAELREALALGIAVNADNPQELARIDAVISSGPGSSPSPGPVASPLGLRINAQVGGGSIGALSTATATSKFGIALRDEGARAWVVQAYLDRPWLTRLHTHSGSQGVPLERMAEGVRTVYELAEEINAAAGRRQIDTLDIGGGLPVNFTSDEETPTYAAYARLLRETVPGLLDGRYGLVTEFGRSLLAKHGTVLTRVEYAKSAGGRPIAVTHAGAQVATRTVYDPASWPLRIAAYDAGGRPKTGPAVAQDIAGPACFAGDLLAENRPVPLLEQGDLVAALDTGAYYFSNHYAYNSLARPGVFGFVATHGAAGDAVRFATVRAAQTVAEIVTESGGGYADALLLDD
ncbi:diaminopimelate decarboxylase [Streptomyces scopuliridis]|uniref:Diaminopimelate decarboxylase n=1 Tax=Streptomyces scopuliridis TaxID=452529 RepID=A0ACD4ZNI0_9ACTN|nr:diaminopimelate decarboxylase [Streptomyces scopuliridis]WSB35510.1 diaminopimelate decarboxylase [Streptomyces scopuliridis]WSB99739.1 diaminopimelate decarboxylase [Streptomyces scopuliridis]WSC06562.1 diaminopimelate decarboxylase [Streptomyces scopuliridis]